jgi:hypothetical protein
VFTVTLVLLVIGLPVTAATAYFQGICRQAGGARRLFTWGNVLRGGVAALAVWGVAVTAWLLVARDGGNTEWDLVSGLDEMRRLVGEYDYGGANAIARELDGCRASPCPRSW